MMALSRSQIETLLKCLRKVLQLNATPVDEQPKPLEINEVEQIIDIAMTILPQIQTSALAELDAPITICGDTHAALMRRVLTVNSMMLYDYSTVMVGHPPLDICFLDVQKCSVLMHYYYEFLMKNGNAISTVFSFMRMTVNSRIAVMFLSLNFTNLELKKSSIKNFLGSSFLTNEFLIEVQQGIVKIGDWKVRVHSSDPLKPVDARNSLGSIVPCMPMKSPLKIMVHYTVLGDYVDRGNQSVETICLMLMFRMRYPKDFFILRGNHESPSICRVYGFYDECKNRYAIKIWRKFQGVFAHLPICALVSQRIFCMHGGLSPSFESFNQLRDLKLPFEVPDVSSLVTDILWCDPDRSIVGYQPNRRGVSYVFGEDVVQTFCEKYNIDLIARAHQVVESGYEFFASNKLVTIFSAPNYCGQFDNSAASMEVGESLNCRIRQLNPNQVLPGTSSTSSAKKADEA